MYVCMNVFAQVLTVPGIKIRNAMTMEEISKKIQGLCSIKLVS